jgi:hypothetical protein
MDPPGNESDQRTFVENQAQVKGNVIKARMSSKIREARLAKIEPCDDKDEKEQSVPRLGKSLRVWPLRLCYI